MKKILLSFLIVGFAMPALAERMIQPGERIYVSGDYVSCQSSGSDLPDVPSQPLPPPQTTIYVTVGINYSCLNEIPRTDGKDTARRAAACDSNNRERRHLRGSCTEIESQTDHGLAENIIARSTTVIHSFQKDIVRDAASRKTFSCLVTL